MARLLGCTVMEAHQLFSSDSFPRGTLTYSWAHVLYTLTLVVQKRYWLQCTVVHQLSLRLRIPPGPVVWLHYHDHCLWTLQRISFQYHKGLLMRCAFGPLFALVEWWEDCIQALASTALSAYFRLRTLNASHTLQSCMRLPS